MTEDFNSSAKSRNITTPNREISPLQIREIYMSRKFHVINQAALLLSAVPTSRQIVEQRRATIRGSSREKIGVFSLAMSAYVRTVMTETWDCS